MPITPHDNGKPLLKQIELFQLFCLLSGLLCVYVCLYCVVCYVCECVLCGMLCVCMCVSVYCLVC